MKALVVLVLVLFSISKLSAKSREPNQVNPFPNPAPVNSPTTSQTFNVEDVYPGTAQQASVSQVYCLTSSSQGYSLGVSGNDVRVTRVGNGGNVSYEVYKGQRFVGACAQVHVPGQGH